MFDLYAWAVAKEFGLDPLPVSAVNPFEYLTIPIKLKIASAEICKVAMFLYQYSSRIYLLL